MQPQSPTPLPPQQFNTPPPPPVQPTQPPMQPPQMTNAPLPPPMAPLSKVSKKRFIGPIAALVVFGLAYGGFGALRQPYPTYKSTQDITYNGYKVSTFTDWDKKDGNTGSYKSVSYTDYVSSSSQENIHAQHSIVVAENLLPKSSLVASTKQELIENYTSDNFFEDIRKEISTCTSLTEKNAAAVEATSVKDAFMVVDFTFTCGESGIYASMKGIGRVVISNDGSFGASLVGARKEVYEKNTSLLTEAAHSIAKE